MGDINRVVLVGRLVRDPEIRSTPKGVYVCQFTLASNRYGGKEGSERKEEVGFFDCVAYGRVAELIARYITKGKRLGVDGSLRYNSWVQSDGKKRSKIQIIVENFMFLDSPAESSVSPVSPEHEGYEPEGNSPLAAKSEEAQFDDYDDIPF